MLSTLLSGGDAAASPWILPQGVFTLGFTAGGDFAAEEFLPDGTQQAFPLRGRFDSTFLEVSSRAGLGRGFEAWLKVQGKAVSYVADPLVLPPAGEAPGLADYRASTVSFDQRHIGLADLYLGAAYGHAEGDVRVASALELKVPSGYQVPAETFREGLVQQSALGDDITLGDGRVALEYRLQLGGAFPWGMFLQGDLGYKARFNGPGHQGIAELKIGQAVDAHLVFFVSVQGALTLFEGASLGEGFVAIDPSVSAQDFTAANVRAIPIGLDQDSVRVQGGAIVRLEGREVQLGASRVVWGKNIPALTGIFLGTTFVLDGR